MALFAIGGHELFSLFGITLPAFRIAGGMMIGLIGYHMLQGEHSNLHRPSATSSADVGESPLDIAITPLGIPVLAGPGTIATAMHLAADSTVTEVVHVIVAFALICGLTFIAFIGGPGSPAGWVRRRSRSSRA